MIWADRVLATAASQIGYSRWTDPQTGTKYARETQPVLWPDKPWIKANNVSYCDIFVTWCFWKAGALDALPGRASYNTDVRANAGRRAGALVPLADAQPGDVLVYDWNRATAATNHVGILERITPTGNVQAIEGNTSVGSAGSQGNGGVVARRVRAPQTVRYVIRPQWDKIAVALAGPAGGASVPVVKPAAKAPAAKGAGKLVVDGILGRASGMALQRFLNSRGAKLVVDGWIGPKTWAALQAYLHTPVDGRVSGQVRAAAQIGAAITGGWDTGRGGSTMVRALQKWVGVTIDGIWGPDTSRGLQAKLNAHGVGM